MSKKLKITIIGLGCFLLVAAGLGKYMFSTPKDADKYDTDNYIGAADVSKDQAEALQVKREDMSAFTIEGDVAHMSGYISSDTIRQVKKLIKTYPDVKTINMVNVGGSVDDVSNLEASRLVRQAGLNTLVKKDGLIASGGTDFFCAGIVRTVEEGGKVGVHSWAGGDVKNAALLPEDHKDHQKYIDYYQEMKMPLAKEFYFFTINAAKADDIYYMTMDELIKYGLIQS